MTHCLIIGQTLSGKSTLARRLSRHYASKGVPSLIYDPIGESVWRQCGEAHKDFAAYMEAVKSKTRCALFVDEAGMCYADNGRDMLPLATSIRHYGHRTHFITQRFTGIPPTMRDQCAYLYLFATSNADGEILAKEWNCPELANCNTLGVGHFIRLKRLGRASRGRLFA